MDTQTREIIEDVLRSNRVVLFMKGQRQQPQCGFSAKTVAALDMLLPEYLDINVLDHPEIREGIKVYGNWPTIPQLYVGGELIGGSDIVLQMFESGELAEVLGVEAPASGTPRVEVAADAAAMMRSAMEQRQGVVVHLRIDARWQHALSLGPVAAGDLCVATGGIDLYMEPWTAARADGLRISMEESLQGTRARFDNPNAPPPVQQMSVSSLKARMDAGEALQLIDVRGPDEREKAAIAGARPWDEATDRMLDALPRDAMVVFHCHKGGRSQKAAEYLRGRGFRNVHNLAGGIDAWSLEIDPAVPRY
ncbi:Glutaredoxin 4 [Gammaproteobacteria bacterium]|nr:Grx4 family monothiol glutaredoxin [Gammaproteobacteria bacterium]QOJ32181.1 MAG: Grx4 family monothiol glutaredoxin [Gammaproteobacteria bacterium]CAG0946660.1 Glutaredoxin 4 [Gammaproteobacteria bacterium]